jgi:hypothetical protein
VDDRWRPPLYGTQATMKAAWPAIAILCSVALLGCGGEAEVNVGNDEFTDERSADIEQEILDDLAADVGVTPRAVECPASPPDEEGATFECTGTAPAGDQFTIEVTNGPGEDFSAVVPPEQFGQPAQPAPAP